MPYDTSALVPYDSRYLAGFVAERYQVNLQTAWDTGRSEMAGVIHGLVVSDIPGDTYRNLDYDIQAWDKTFKHCLVPVWIAAYRYKEGLSLPRERGHGASPRDAPYKSGQDHRSRALGRCTHRCCRLVARARLSVKHGQNMASPCYSRRLSGPRCGGGGCRLPNGEENMALVDVIQWNALRGVYAVKHPKTDLGTWTQLIVQETQEAMLMKEGRYFDLLRGATLWTPRTSRCSRSSCAFPSVGRRRSLQRSGTSTRRRRST